MKNETLRGSTDATGLFTAKSPYQAYCYEKGGTYEAKIKAFEILYPPLFCYNENNVLVKGVEGLEVKGPVWQANFFKNIWETVTEERYIRSRDYRYQCRQVYIAVQPTEKAEPIQYTNEEYLDLHGATDGTYPKPASKEGKGTVGEPHNPQALKSISTFNKMLSYAGKYEISIQFWGKGYTNVFISKGGVDLHDFGGLDPDKAIEETVKYLDRINKKS